MRHLYIKSLVALAAMGAVQQEWSRTLQIWHINLTFTFTSTRDDMLPHSTNMLARHMCDVADQTEETCCIVSRRRSGYRCSMLGTRMTW